MKTVDMHCDTIAELFYRKREGKDVSILRNDCHVDLERMEKGDYCLQNFALFTCLDREKEPFKYCMKLLDLFYTEMEQYKDRIGIVKSFGDIKENMEAGRMSAMLTIEEGEACEGELAFLRNFYRLGVRMMTLTWNYPNKLGYPNHIRIEDGKAFFEPDGEHGLTETGIAFLEEMERLGVIVDISHLSDAGIWDVFRYTKKPFVASHSNARAVAENPRNLTDEMIRKLSERGGVAGINYCAAFLHDWEDETQSVSRVEDMVAHMKHMKKIGGIGCIGLGSDFDGIGGMLEMNSPEKLPMLEAAMGKAGFTESEIEAVFYKNVLRVYEELLV